MNYNLLDLLFSHPRYTGMSLVLKFDRPLCGRSLKEASTQWMRSFDVFQSTPLPEHLEEHFANELDLSDPQLAQTFAVQVFSGDECPFAYRLLHGPQSSYLFMSMSHQLGDGMSLMMWIQGLMHIMNKEKISELIMDRQLIAQAAHGIEISENDLLQAQTGITGTPNNATLSTSQIKLRPKVFISHDELGPLKKEGFTAFEIISAQILKNRDQDVTVIMPFNLRGEKYNIPLNFFGNAVKAESLYLSVEQIRKSSMSELILSLQELKRKSNPQNFAASYRLLENMTKNNDPHILQNLRISSPSTLLITDLTRFPIGLNCQGAKLIDVAMLSPYAQGAAILKTDKGFSYQLAARS